MNDLGPRKQNIQAGGSDHTAKNTQVDGVDGPTRNLVIPEVLTSQEPLGGCITQQVTSQEILDVSRWV